MVCSLFQIPHFLKVLSFDKINQRPTTITVLQNFQPLLRSSLNPFPIRQQNNQFMTANTLLHQMLNDVDRSIWFFRQKQGRDVMNKLLVLMFHIEYYIGGLELQTYILAIERLNTNILFMDRRDERLYHYEYRRPRLSNPTFISSGMGNSMIYSLSRKQNPYSHYDLSYNIGSSLDLAGQRGGMLREPPRASSQIAQYGERNLALGDRGIQLQYHPSQISGKQKKYYNEGIKKYAKPNLEPKDENLKLRRLEPINLHHPTNPETRQIQIPPREKELSSYQGRHLQPRMTSIPKELSHLV